MNPSAGNTTIAYVKRPAINETVDTPNIQMNGGEPGGSTVSILLSSIGDMYAARLGEQYSLIAFDPRGVTTAVLALTVF
jgi:hypothetical protein